MPLFAVVMTGDGIEARVKQAGLSVFETDHPEEFKAFRDAVRSKVCKHFSDGPTLQLAIYETLLDIIRRHEATMAGWVSGRDARDSAEANRRIADLSDEASQLRRELADAQANAVSILPPAIDPGLDKLIEALGTISVPAIERKGEAPIATAADYLGRHGPEMITGVLTVDLAPAAALEMFGLVTTTRMEAGTLRIKTTPLGNRVLLYGFIGKKTKPPAAPKP